jgi:hypothetical protein
MENLLIVPKNKEEFSFLQELLAKLNIATQVVENEFLQVSTSVRNGWAESMQAMAMRQDDSLLIPEIYENDEWTW